MYLPGLVGLSGCMGGSKAGVVLLSPAGTQLQTHFWKPWFSRFESLYPDPDHPSRELNKSSCKYSLQASIAVITNREAVFSSWLCTVAYQSLQVVLLGLHHMMQSAVDLINVAFLAESELDGNYTKVPH